MSEYLGNGSENLGNGSKKLGNGIFPNFENMQLRG